MKKNLKLLACFLALLLTVSFTACTPRGEDEGSTPDDPPAETGDEDDERLPGLGDGTFVPDYDFDYNPHYDIPAPKPKNVVVNIHKDVPVTFKDGTKSYKAKVGSEFHEVDTSNAPSEILGWYNVDDRTQYWDAEGMLTPTSASGEITIAPYYAIPGYQTNPGVRGDSDDLSLELVHSVEDGPSMGTAGGRWAAVGNYLGFRMEFSLHLPANQGNMNAQYGVVSPEFAEKYVMRMASEKTTDKQPLPIGDYSYHHYFYNYGDEPVSFSAYYGSGGFTAVDVQNSFTEGVVTINPHEGASFDSVYHNPSATDKNVLMVFVFEQPVEEGLLGIAMSRYDPAKPEEALFNPILPYGGALEPEEEPAAGQLLTLSSDYVAQFSTGAKTRKVTVGAEIPRIVYSAPQGETLYGWYNVDDPSEFWAADAFSMPDKALTIAPIFSHHGGYLQPGDRTQPQSKDGFYYAVQNGNASPITEHKATVLPIVEEDGDRFNYVGQKVDFDIRGVNAKGEHGLIVTTKLDVNSGSQYKFRAQFYNFGAEAITFTPYLEPPQGNNGIDAYNYTSEKGQKIAALTGGNDGKITLEPGKGILIPAFEVEATADADNIRLVLIFDTGSPTAGTLGIGLSDATHEEGLHRVTFRGNGGYFNRNEETEELTFWLAEGTGFKKYSDFLKDQLDPDNFYTAPEGKTLEGWYNTELSDTYTHAQYELDKFDEFTMGPKNVVIAPYFEVAGTTIPVGYQNNNGKWPGTDNDRLGYESLQMAGIQAGYTASSHTSFTVVAGQPHGRVWSFSSVEGAAKDQKPSSLTNDGSSPTDQNGVWFRIISAYKGEAGQSKLVLKNKTITFHVAFENFGSGTLKFRLCIVESGHSLTNAHWYNNGESITLTGNGDATSKTLFDFDVTYSSGMGDNFNVMPILWFDTDVTDGHLGFACSWEWKD